LRGLAAGRFALLESQAQERLTLGRGLFQASARSGVKGATPDFQHGFAVSGIQYLLLAIVGAPMAN